MAKVTPIHNDRYCVLKDRKFYRVIETWRKKATLRVSRVSGWLMIVAGVVYLAMGLVI